MNTKDRIILFKDERYAIRNKNLYVFVKEENDELTTSRTNKIYTMFRTFKNDKEALRTIKEYKIGIENINQVVGLEHFIDLMYINPEYTLSGLANTISRNYYKHLSNLIINNNYIYAKNNSIKIEKAKNGYSIKANSNEFTINPMLSIMEHVNIGNFNTIRYLLINKLPNGVSLLTDTNPERNILQETV